MTTDPHAHPIAAAVLLAGGESTRMRESMRGADGREIASKALLSWTGGEPLIAYQVRALDEAGYAPIVVVTGHEASVVAGALPGGLALRTVVNERYMEGRCSSIIAGVREAASLGPDALLVVSVDQPRATATYRMLREAWERDRPAIAVPALDGRAGHPPLFDAALVPDLLRVTEETEGLRQVMRDHAAGRVLVPTDDPLTLLNLNTRDEYEAALRVAGGSRAA